MTNRIEQTEPTNLTRLISIGRQLQRHSERPLLLVKTCKAAKEIGQEVWVVGVGIDRSKGEVFYHVIPVRKDKKASPVFVTMDDFQ